MLIRNLECISLLEQSIAYGNQGGWYELVKMLQRTFSILLEYTGCSTGILCGRLPFRNCVTPRNMNWMGIFYSAADLETQGKKKQGEEDGS